MGKIAIEDDARLEEMLAACGVAIERRASYEFTEQEFADALAEISEQHGEIADARQLAAYRLLTHPSRRPPPAAAATTAAQGIQPTVTGPGPHPVRKWWYEALKIAWGILVLLLLGILAAKADDKPPLHPAFSGPSLAELHPILAQISTPFGAPIIQPQNGGTTLATITSGPIRLNCSTTTMACSWVGATRTFNISSTAASAVTFQTNGVNNASQTTLNLINSAPTNGFTLTHTNTAGGTVQLGLSGSLTVPGGGTGLTTATTNGILFGNGTGAFGVTAAGGAGTLCLVETGGGVPSFGSCAGAAGTSWSALTNPTANLSLSHAANTTTFTWGAATGAGVNLFTFTDTLNNTGTGAIGRFTTASGSAALPIQFDANGNGLKMNTTGRLVAVGTGSIDWAALANFPAGCGANTWVTAVGATLTCIQPAFSNISGVATKAQLPGTTVYTDQANAYTAGQQDFGSAAGITLAKKADPASPVTGEAWINVGAFKFRDNAATPATHAVATNLAGSCAANNWVNAIVADAVPTCAQPAFSNISGVATKAQLPGTTVYTDQANAYTAGQQDFGSAAGITLAKKADPATPATGEAWINLAAFKFRDNAATPATHAVATNLAGSCAANNWVNAIVADAVPTCAQPGFSNLSGSIALGQTPLTTLGDILSVNATPALARVAGNTTTTKQYLSQTGTGTVSALPLFAQVAFGDLSGTATKAQLPTTTVFTDQANTFGAFLQTFKSGANFDFSDPTDTTKLVQFDLSALTTATTRTVKIPDAASSPGRAFAAVANNFLTAFDQTTGIFSSAQPAFSNVSGVATKAQLPATTVFTDQANSYTAGPQNLGTQTLVVQIANEGVTGTTLNKLAKLTGAPSTAIITAITDTGGGVGVIAAGAGTTGSAQVVVQGRVNCVFEGATTAGDYVILGSVTAGDCKDGGATYPTAGEVVGRVLTTNAAAGTFEILVFPLEERGFSGAPCTVTANSLQYNNAGAFGCVTQFTYVSPTVSLAAGGKLDLSAGNTIDAFKVPSFAGAAPTAQAALDYDTTQDAFVAGGRGTIKGYVPRMLGIGWSSATASASFGQVTMVNNDDLACGTIGTTETFYGSSIAVPANFFQSGKALEITLTGQITTPAATTTLIGRIYAQKAGPVNVALYQSIGGINAPGSMTNQGWGVQYIIQGTAAPGAGVNVFTGILANGGGNQHFLDRNSLAQPIAFDTNIAETIKFSLQCGAATAGQDLRITELIVKELF